MRFSFLHKGFFVVLLLVIPSVIAGICLYDSDGGFNIYEKGVINATNQTYEDFCNGTLLTEYYCSSNSSNATVAFSIVNCSLGCNDGACIQSNDWCDHADIDMDTDVDSDDYNILASNWNSINCSLANQWCNFADINRDGSVNGLDFSILSNNYGRTDCIGY